jgi:primosomal protein N'
LQLRAYFIALVTRGAGAFTYTYSWADELLPGQLVAVPFQNRLEIGLALGLDANPPAKTLISLIPLKVQRWPSLGRRLLDMCELSLSAPDELAGHLLFDSARNSLRLELSLVVEQLSEEQRQRYGLIAGRLKPTHQKMLAKLWPEAANLASQGWLALEINVAGDPDTTRALATWRRDYELSAGDKNLLGITALTDVFAGSYLGGFEGADLKAYRSIRTREHQMMINEPGERLLDFSPLILPEAWELPRQWPKLRHLTMRRTACTWPQLRSETGLLAELQYALSQSHRVLVIAPQVWMIERLWSILAPLAGQLARFKPEAGLSIAAHIQRMLARGPAAVVGGPGAWKLAAYCPFDRIIIIDPSHPQYASERTPHLDPRLALLLCSAQNENTTTLDLVNFGLDALHGWVPDVPFQLHQPYNPLSTESPPADAVEDIDPLPLILRRPDKRRLVYYNRLGSGRGLYCAECRSSVTCPRCGSVRVHFSGQLPAYVCPDCSWRARDLRCPRCHLMNLASVLPGLEAVTARPGDLVLRGPTTRAGQHNGYASVIGTSQLLEPVAGFSPEQLIYIHAEGRGGLVADWPAAMDMVLRLRALYDNPHLSEVHVVSETLVGQLGRNADSHKVEAAYLTELNLRELTGLPPFGTLYHFTLVAARLPSLNVARQQLGETLHSLPDTQMLRIGTAYRQRSAHRLGAWLINPTLSMQQVQELRWLLHRLEVTLIARAMRGPWVW